MSADFSKLENIQTQLTTFDRIKVPVYQRSYSWEREYVEVFWNDIVESINEDRDKYFIGPIITKNLGEKNVELIDGQQRITTSLVLLSILRRFYFFENQKNQNEDLNKNYNSLSTRFINEDPILGDDGEPKYEMNSENSTVYIAHVLADTTLEEIKQEQSKYKKHESNYLLTDSLIFLWEAVEKFCGDDFDSNKLKKIAAFVLSRLQVLNIRVSDEADAFLIFETINDRGRELDTLDLVKNLLFSQSKRGDFETVKDNWIKMMENLGSLSNYSDFLNQFWISKHGNYVKSNLYSLIREFIKQDRDNARILSKQLLDSSRIFSAIGNLEDDYWKNCSVSAYKSMSTLKMLGAKAVNPTIMAASLTFDKDEFTKLLKYLVIYQVRYVLISDSHTNKYSQAMASIPPLLDSPKYKKAIKVAKKLKELGVYVSDEQFKEKFIQYIAPTTKKAKYLLAEIEHFEAGNDKIINDDSTQVNIEHIMPQARSEGWTEEVTGVKNEDYDDTVNMLGNLCLTNSRLNKAAKNLPFKNKKEILFEKSDGIVTTLKINEEKEWNKEKIKHRQESLADNVLDIWGIKFQ